MTKEEKKIIADEVAKTFELYGFEMSFSEFKDIFELGAEFGYRLASIGQMNGETKEAPVVKNTKRPFAFRF